MNVRTKLARNPLILVTMKRRVELERAHYVTSTVANRNEENKTRDWCKLDEISREKTLKLRLAKEKEEQAEMERRRRREDELRERRRQDETERMKAAQLIAERQQQKCDAKTRQRLREECEELRNLESQLRTAYIAKEQAFQRGERRTRELQEKVLNSRE